jgi:hypothetical protein
VQLFESRHPGCAVNVSENAMAEPLGALRRRELDLIAFDLPLEREGITIGPIMRRDRRLLAVSANHPLTRRESISLEDIPDFEAHDYSGNYPAQSLDAWSPPRTPSGRPIRRRHLRSATFSHLFALVAAGEIAHFASDPVFLRYPGIIYVPISDMPPVESALIWLTDEETAAMRAFAQAAREVLDKRRTTRSAPTEAPAAGRTVR